MLNLITQNSFLLSNILQKEPGITKPITEILGIVLNFVYNFVYNFTVANSLGIAIILFTIFVRLCMLPLAIKQQKSMAKMQEIQPQIKKIQEKYKDNKDPEVQKKMQMETQKLYSENKVNPLSGCLPLFIQMPIFVALSYIMNHAYLFVDKLGAIYTQISTSILSVANFADANFMTPFLEIVQPKFINGVSVAVDTTDGMSKLINVFTDADWQNLFALLPTDTVTQITEILTTKISIETFYGIDLTTKAGLSFPGIFIPILAAVTTFLTSYLAMKVSNTSTGNDQAAQTQKTMMYVMPIMMFFMSMGLSAGVGLYWITSSVFQVFQQMFLNHNIRKKYHLDKYKDDDTIEGKAIEKTNNKNTNNNSSGKKGKNKNNSNPYK